MEKTKTFELEPGDYEVFLKIDWCRSNKVQLTLLEGEKKPFLAGSSVRGANGLLIFFYILFHTVQVFMAKEKVALTWPIWRS